MYRSFLLSITIPLFSMIAAITLHSQSINQIALSDSIEAYMERSHMPGAMVTIVAADSVLWQGTYGYADIDKAIEVGEEHLFRIGSISKTFVSMAIMKLIEEGKLSLNDKLSDLAPEVPFNNPYEEEYPIQLKHLLEHKAGFDDMHFKTLAAVRPIDITALEEVMFHKNSLSSRWEPGLVSSYSNPGYALLGFIIEKVSGRAYQDYVRDEILIPMGMTHSLFFSQVDHTTNPECVGYSYSDDSYEPARKIDIMGESAGAILSSSEDMVHFLQFLLKGDSSGTPLSMATIKEMEQLHSWFESDNNLSEGYGLGIYSRNYGSEDIPFRGHNGGINGFISDYIYSRDHNIAIMISNNGETSNGKLMDYLVDQFLPDVRIVEPQLVPTTIENSDWDGHYRLLNLRNELVFFIQYPFAALDLQADGDTLKLQVFLNEEHTFYHVGDNAYVKKGDKHPTLFLTNRDNQPCIYYDKDILIPMNASLMWFWRILLGLALLSGFLLLLILVVQGMINIFKKSLKISVRPTLVFGAPAWLFVISMLGLATASSMDQIAALGSVSLRSIVTLLATSLLPIATMYACFYIWKHWHKFKNRLVRYLYTIVVIASVGLSIYCIKFGWVAKALWVY